MRTRLERWLNAVWYNQAWSGQLLRPLSALYGLIVFLRRAMYRRGWLSSHRAAVPVVIVGNITAGGVGKTPLVEWLVRMLDRQGLKPGVMTRGYGASLSASTRVTQAHTAEQVGDEALMLARRLSVPVIAGPNRAESAAMLEAAGVSVIVCDDGLQHYALARDVEICVIDEQRGLGNQRLLPSGPLRESANRLKQVDVVVYHRATDTVNATASSVPPGSMVLANPRVRNLLTAAEHGLDEFQAEPVHAVAGVGNPTRFFRSLENAGLNVIKHPFPDHHPFVSEDLEFASTHPVLMTDKDAIKCERFARPHFFAVSVEAIVASDVEASILSVLESASSVEDDAAISR